MVHTFSHSPAHTHILPAPVIGVQFSCKECLAD